jgi:hypothetical protein
MQKETITKEELEMTLSLMRYFRVALGQVTVKASKLSIDIASMLQELKGEQLTREQLLEKVQPILDRCKEIGDKQLQLHNAWAMLDNNASTIRELAIKEGRNHAKDREPTEH